ncbi:helix-turn-helix transcriptional regulator [Streptomyces sp. NPDC005012]|uniref:helix-turn-helix domain-containing protein n=1 Tax=Streptomyces sp. NPDC005012 TaxID=3154558 RepID=UPI0033B1BAB8
MAPGHVAYGMRASYGMTYVTPDHITAWERGIAVPSLHELTALAGALWCAPGDLMGAPRTLREHRLARGMAPEDVAQAIGMPLGDYLRMEESGRWTGTPFQAGQLGSALQLPPSAMIAITGLEEQLASLLVEAVSTRWQAHIKAVARLVSMEKRDLQDTLRTMHGEYQNLMAMALGRTSAAAASAEEGKKNYLDNIVQRFWECLGHR